MEKLIVLGTGAANAVKYYNTCFILEGGAGSILVDGGGGNGIFSRLEAVGKAPGGLEDVFVSHEHIDHLLGIIWLVRMCASAWLAGRRAAPLRIHCHAPLAEKIRTICSLTLGGRMQAALGKGVVLLPVADGERRIIAGHEAVFFDTGSRKALQFGMHLRTPEGRTVLFCGDEPFRRTDVPLFHGADWLLHEAFCLERDGDAFHPHAIGHGTVKEAAACAASTGARNLVLWHTEDSATFGRRKELYAAEAASVFGGKVWVPDDLETIPLA